LRHILLSYLLHLTFFLFFSRLRPPPISTLFPYTTLFRSRGDASAAQTATNRGTRPALRRSVGTGVRPGRFHCGWRVEWTRRLMRSEEHTSELQSRFDLVCRLLLEKKK